MSLPSIPNEVQELELARAFNHWLDSHLGDQEEISEEERLARYGYMRVHRMELLNDLARKAKPEADSFLIKARQMFDSENCPACFQPKRKGKDFVCKSCWDQLPREKKTPLIPGWKDGKNVDNFLRAVNWLRYEATKPVVCR